MQQMSKRNEGLKKCANGCDAPPSPPSKVICRECIDKITAKLEAWAGHAKENK